MRTKKTVILNDFLGKDLQAGSPVVFFHRGWATMVAGRVKKCSRVCVTVEFASRFGVITRIVRAEETLLLSEEDYIFHSLRNKS